MILFKQLHAGSEGAERCFHPALGAILGRTLLRAGLYHNFLELSQHSWVLNLNSEAVPVQFPLLHEAEPSLCAFVNSRCMTLPQRLSA